MPTPRAAGSHRRPAQQGGTCLPRQMCPRSQVVQAALLTLPSPARPRSRGMALPSPAEGFNCPPSPAGKGSPHWQVTEHGHKGLWAGWGRPALPGQQRAAPAGRPGATLSPTLSPTFLREAVPKAPGAPPGAAASGSSGKGAARLCLSRPTCWTGGGMATGSARPAAPSARGKATQLPVERRYLKDEAGGSTGPYKGTGREPAGR